MLPSIKDKFCKIVKPHYKRGKNSSKAEMNSYPIGWRRMESRTKNWRSLHYYTEDILYTLYY